jgi:hypothetical protein
MLVANGGLNVAHPIMWFGVVPSRKPWGSNVKQKLVFAKL